MLYNGFPFLICLAGHFCFPSKLLFSRSLLFTRTRILIYLCYNKHVWPLYFVQFALLQISLFFIANIILSFRCIIMY
uniref:Uncharacterized protein n=1 Tax=Aegilops tauschii subsp. strangulata TaxID=200361 RepID=A0A453E2X4_AEGTS